jgi:quercetin dioxygenase-like cupin family protein
MNVVLQLGLRLLILTMAVLVCGATVAEELPDPLAAGWNGQPVCEKLHEDDELRILRCSFPPGVGHERHYHPRHVGYVVAGGTMRVTDASGTRDVDVSAGDTFSSPGIPWHEGVNVGDTTTTYLMIEPR